MAERPVFVQCNEFPYYKVCLTEFVWNKGLNIKQRQKNILALHAAFGEVCPDVKVLEISTKSLQPEGLPLSALNLEKFVPSLNRNITVEGIYQGGKVFENAGPFFDLYDIPSNKIKKDERLKRSGHLKEFQFDGNTYPNIPSDAFYNWIYISALKENEEFSSVILNYSAFTDISFNHKVNISCQAKAAAIYKSLFECDKLDKINDFNDFLNVVYEIKIDEA